MRFRIPYPPNIIDAVEDYFLRKRARQEEREREACPRDNYGLFRRAAMSIRDLPEIISLVLLLNREARRLE